MDNRNRIPSHLLINNSNINNFNNNNNNNTAPYRFFPTQTLPNPNSGPSILPTTIQKKGKGKNRTSKKSTTNFNVKDLSEVVFDIYLQVDLLQSQGLFKDHLWAVCLHLFGQETLTKLMGWLGRIIHQKIIEEKTNELRLKSPHLKDKQLEEQANQWLSDQEKKIVKTTMAKRVILFIKIKWSPPNAPPQPPPITLEILAETLGLRSENLWPIYERDLGVWLEQYNENELKKSSKIEILDPKFLSIPVEYDPSSTDFKKRKIESHSLGNRFNGFGQSGPFPLVQITKTQLNDFFQIHIHLYIPFLEGKLRVYVHLNRILISGNCQRRRMINEVRTEKIMDFKFCKALDELIFLEGPFEKEIYLGEVVDPASLTFEAPDKFIRILHLNVKVIPPLGFEA